jgi:ElaB/YqjD/DUF883 family membrane-anchored ribosome-binding protein
MAESLRKPPLEIEEETIELEIVPGAALPGIPTSDDYRGLGQNADNNLTRRTAESVGNRVGKAVNAINSSVRSGLDVVSEGSRQAGEKFAEAAEETRVHAQKLALEAGRRAQDLRDAAIYRARKARSEARRFANERPIEIILGIAGAAFVVGVVLRIWRSNRD